MSGRVREWELTASGAAGEHKVSADLDLIIRNAKLAGPETDRGTVDIGVQDGIIVAIEPVARRERTRA